MVAMMRNAIFGIVGVVGLLVTSQASAVIITDQGIETVTKHFYIDETVSSITHNPGFNFYGIPAQTYTLSGEFDASFSRYWWSYYLDGDSQGTQGTFIFEQNWLTFSNANLTWANDPGGFVFPNYFVAVNGASLSGDQGACTGPYGPDMYCSGWTMAPIASLTGTTDDGSIQLHGSMPIQGGMQFESFTYDILAHTTQANAIPEPKTLALFLTGLVGLMFAKRRKQERW